MKDNVKKLKTRSNVSRKLVNYLHHVSTVTMEKCGLQAHHQVLELDSVLLFHHHPQGQDNPGVDNFPLRNNPLSPDIV